MAVRCWQSSTKFLREIETFCSAGLLGRLEVGVVGQRRVAAHAEVVLHAALGGQAVVVPPHGVEDLLARHALVARDQVRVGVAEDVADVQRARDRRRGGVDGVDLRRARPSGRSGRPARRPSAPATSPRVRRWWASRERCGNGGRRSWCSEFRPGASTRLLSARSARRRHAARRARWRSLVLVLRLYDTVHGEVRDLATRDPGRLSMYVCGPTVYDLPHLGHGRFTLVWDVARRWFTFRGTRRALRLEHHRYRRQHHQPRPA